MFYGAPDSAELEEIQELNLLFLLYLRSCAREGGDCLGLPASIVKRLREHSSATLEAMAAFPRSLFILDLDNITAAREQRQHPRGALDHSRQALSLTVLHSAWNMSRQRDFQARMFLRLSVAATRRLRTIPLSELPLMAAAPGLLHCAFPRAQSLWATSDQTYGFRDAARPAAHRPASRRGTPPGTASPVSASFVGDVVNK